MRIIAKTVTLLLLAAVAASAQTPGTAAPTTVRITGNVLVPDCIRLGINLGGDAYYNGAALVKKRVRANFEYDNGVEAALGPFASIDRIDISFTFNG